MFTQKGMLVTAHLASSDSGIAVGCRRASQPRRPRLLDAMLST